LALASHGYLAYNSVMFSFISLKLTAFANIVPLKVFVLIGSFVEEVIAPIPAPVVMTTAGSIAFLEKYTLIGVFVLALIGALGKTGGSWALYYIADKGEDFILGRFGRFFQISHAEVERLGSYFSGSWKDTLILFILRAIPVVPSLALDLGSGIIKLKLRTYLIGTFFGLIVRGFFFLYIGYAGIRGYEYIATRISDVENYAEFALVATLIAALGLLYWQRQTGAVTRWLSKIFGKEKARD